MYKIIIGQEGIGAKKVLKRVRPYQTLLEICLENGIELSHQCGGVCHCTTCMVLVMGGKSFLDEASKREQDFIKRNGKGRSNARLGCQTMLLEGEGEIEIWIPKPDED